MKPTKPFYQDNHNTIHCLDFRKNEMPDESVQCVVTSPPFWSLRKYSGEQDLIWGGDDHCEHQWSEENILRKGHPGDKSTLIGSQTATIAKEAVNQGSFCSLCSAWRGAFGLEPTPELFIQHLIEIMREIKRVLRRDGVCFINIGDSYATHASGGKGYAHNFRPPDVAIREGIDQPKPTAKSIGLKEKDLCLIPFRVAIAAQEDGWWVRSVIIWSKPNPMPESVTDRPTRSYEYILMLTKSGTTQYWTHRDLPGTRVRPKPDYRWVNRVTNEEVATEPLNWREKIVCPDCDGTGNINKEIGWYIEEDKCSTCNGKGKTTLWKRINLWRGHDYYWDADAVREISTERPSGNKERKYRRDYGGPEAHTGRQGFSIPYQPNGTGRNLRSVWTFPTTPFPAAHFAVFPEKLPELCIKAATPEVGCCSKCGAPWTRVIKKGFTEHTGETSSQYPKSTTAKRLAKLRQSAREHGGEYQSISETLGWQPTCICQADKAPSLVLDPLMGAGTTLLVAKKLNRRCVGYELSHEYCQLAVERCRQQVLGG